MGHAISQYLAFTFVQLEIDSHLSNQLTKTPLLLSSNLLKKFQYIRFVFK